MAGGVTVSAEVLVFLLAIGAGAIAELYRREYEFSKQLESLKDYVYGNQRDDDSGLNSRVDSLEETVDEHGNRLDEHGEKIESLENTAQNDYENKKR